jgi:drug/metabolite transporter (DMT)-like permease
MFLTAGQRAMLLATTLLSLMGVLVKHLRHLPVHEVVTFRAGVSLVLCWIMLRQRRQSPWGRRRGLLLARGAAGTAALLLYFHTLQAMPLASAVTVQYLSPLFTILLAGVVLREGATRQQWACFVLCFAGVALLKGFDTRVSAVDLSIGVGAALCSAAAYTLVRQLKGSDSPLVVVFYFPLVTLPVIGSYTALHWVPPAGWDWLWLISVGVLTQGGQLYLTRAYHLERATNVSQFSYLGSLYALAFGYVFFGEAVPLLSLAGIALVVAGVFLATGRGAARRASPAS